MPVPFSDLLYQGVQLMITGMGIVFIFLIVLVGVMKLMSIIAGRFPESEEAPVAVSAQPSHQATQANNNVIAAISVAVKRYRSKKT